MPYKRTLFIFRRDLRVADNTALIHALAVSRQVALVFIFDPRQCREHAYFSANAFQFLQASLDELAGDIRRRGGELYFFYGRAEEVVDDLLARQKFDAVFINKDYTPFSLRRDAVIKRVCLRLGAAYEAYDDALLCPPGSVVKMTGGPYAVFTPFFRKASAQPIDPPRKNTASNLLKEPLKTSFCLHPGQIKPLHNSRLAVKGGRCEGLALLRAVKEPKAFSAGRDIPSADATSHLAAHLKFGVVSVREVFHDVVRRFTDQHPLVEQLYWRDFFTHIAYYFPHVFGGCFYEQYDAIPWRNNKRKFTAWCEGRTGVPIVDAGMRELNTTGFMHNRVRMLAASYLVKDLHIDWRWGEKYFATRLVDYDPAVNNGNWQWAASTGCDHQPYFRVFNPWLQQKKFDAACVYVRKWVPELAALTPVQISGLGDPGAHASAVSWVKAAFRLASQGNLIQRGE